MLFGRLTLGKVTVYGVAKSLDIYGVWPVVFFYFFSHLDVFLSVNRQDGCINYHEYSGVYDATT